MPAARRRLPITACLIALDEERDLPGALESVDFAAEIVVAVDRRTRDGTREAARAFHRPDRPVRIFEKEWEGHVAQKNFAIQQARCDWILSLDADERVSPELRRELEDLFEWGPAADGYIVNRRTCYLGRWMTGGGWYPDRKLRLFHRGRGRWVGVDPHDRLVVEGTVEALRGDLLHLSYRDLSDHLRKVDLFTSIAAEGKLRRRARRPLARALNHAPARFIKMYFWKGGYRDGMQGVIAAGMGALYVFLKYAKLWEMLEAERRLPGASASLDPRARPSGASAASAGTDEAGP